MPTTYCYLRCQYCPRSTGPGASCHVDVMNATHWYPSPVFVSTCEWHHAGLGRGQSPGSSGTPRSPITIAMIRFLKETWLATAVFVGLSRLNADRQAGWIGCFTATITAAVLVPPVWRWFVMCRGRPRIGRAALAGATVGFLIAISPAFIGAAWYEARPPRYTDGFGEGLSGFLLLFVLIALGSVGGALGTGVAMLVALLQRRWLHRREQPGAADSRLGGAIGGALVATFDPTVRHREPGDPVLRGLARSHHPGFAARLEGSRAVETIAVASGGSAAVPRQRGGWFLHGSPRGRGVREPAIARDLRRTVPDR
jgi:hypothetical protein